MQNGQVVFDGSPEELTPEKANQVYGNEGLEELREANFTNKDQIESIAA
jgi:ABC-type phosphate/phosphonate transport system ATPase subunit